jgi:hypothetical protein
MVLAFWGGRRLWYATTVTNLSQICFWLIHPINPLSNVSKSMRADPVWWSCSDSGEMKIWRNGHFVGVGISSNDLKTFVY